MVGGTEVGKAAHDDPVLGQVVETAKVVELFVVGAINWTGEWYDPRRGTFDAFCEEILTIIFDGIGSNDGRSGMPDKKQDEGGDKWKEAPTRSP